jgi:hypothetical protein
MSVNFYQTTWRHIPDLILFVITAMRTSDSIISLLNFRHLRCGVTASVPHDVCRFCRANPAFNKEVFVDLMAAQIKTLSFLAYIVRMYQEMVAQHSNLMVKGLLGMLTICPMEVTHMRKELLIASRHILATDLRVSEYCHEILSALFSVPYCPCFTVL